ncbi:host attachment protein [Ramlibacter ginsenosidimutans]|uniref:Host attachment protein n=2 Tax=Ramlibacter ginsenosidimutans TaxID=502333 RepID=A0A934WNU6_9BURK|nr:host attachment protein [Ramlibacter ginsenosidimutans]
MQRLARHVADVLEQAYAQARFEFLRIAVEPRFEGPLRAEIDRRLDLHRAVLEWRALQVIPPASATARP